MRYVAAYMLSALSGNENPSADDLRSIIGSVGLEVDEEKLQLVMQKLQGKNVEELIAENVDKLATVTIVTQKTTAADSKTETGDAPENKPTPEDDSEDDGDEDDFMLDIFG